MNSPEHKFVIEPAIEPERYEFNSPSLHQFALARRDFFKLLGTGITVFAVNQVALATQETAPGPRIQPPQLPKEITSWLHIGDDGSFTAFTGKVEVGQNARTSLTQSVADELRVPFSSVRMVMGDTELTPFDMGTFGSRTTPTMVPQLRRVAEAARNLLVEVAAKQWNVAPAVLKAANARVTDPASGKSLTYAELARGKTLAQFLPDADPTTPPSEWTIAGQPLPKVDARDFVTGKHQYTADLRPDKLLYAKILRPPSFGATLASCDVKAAAAMPDVVVVVDGNFVGAAAPTERQAETAVAAIRAQWNESPQKISDREIFDYLKRNTSADSDRRNEKQPKGSISDGLASATRKLESVYTVAYIAHAPLEPRAAVAEWKNSKMTVWTGTQRPFAVRTEVANVLRIPESTVRVIVPDTGSAYGGKHTGDAAVEAARLAKSANRPVKLVWTREEEFTWAYFRPAGLIEVKSGLDSNGKLTAWEFHNYHSGTSGIETPYDVANQLVEYHSVPLVLRCGSYRGLAATANHFARETHMDELARASNLDPLEFRLRNLSDKRLRAVLEAAAQKFGWPPKKSKEGQGFGIAAGNEKGSYVATCAEVISDPKANKLQVIRLVTAFECGAVVNPDGLRNQVIGANIQGLGGALYEAIRFENGRINNPHFASYRVPRFRDLPAIEAVLLDRKDIPSAGAGETPIMAVAPAVGNALFDATGVRRRAMPLASGA
ncbi:MAG TPA: molybdopterin cofactor-binding domain-containing protein [Candidatus Acidoferrum sp.]|nr:molybdopterin cofactor-binding domain-containing protein [Candidatus Acidoferrum sp.]